MEKSKTKMPECSGQEGFRYTLCHAQTGQTKERSKKSRNNGACLATPSCYETKVLLSNCVATVTWVELDRWPRRVQKCKAIGRWKPDWRKTGSKHLDLHEGRRLQWTKIKWMESGTWKGIRLWKPSIGCPQACRKITSEVSEFLMVSQENTIRCAVNFRHRCSMCRAGEVAELLTRQQPDDVPVLNDASTIEQITHIEFWTLEQLEFELATFTPMAWVDIFSLRLSLWQQQQQQRRSQTNSHIQPHPPVPSEFLAVFAHQVAAAHVQSFPFCFLSAASQIGATAWFVSILLWVLLSVFAVQ